MSKEIGNILRECKYDASKMEHYQKVAIDNLASQIDNNTALLEAFCIGLFCNESLVLPPKIKNIMEEKCIDSVTYREWYNFNINVLTLLDVESFPNDIKNSCQNYTQLFDHIDLYAPEFFYPKVHQQKKLLQLVSIGSLKDVIDFNHQFKKIFGFLIDNFINSNLFQKFAMVDTNAQINKLNIYQTKYKLINNNKIYKSSFNNKKLISIDLKQANCTIIFLYYGLQMFDKLEDMGLNFEKFFSSKQDMINNFNWSTYVKASLEKYSNNNFVVKEETFQILCQLFENSKMMRQLIIGVMSKKKPVNCSSTIMSLYESTCKTLMFDLFESLQPLLQTINAKVISLSTDEIIIEGSTLKNINQHLISNPIGEKSYIVEKYIRVEEFILQRGQF